MRTEHQTTPEEEAYKRLVEENWETLTKAAHTIVAEAKNMALAYYLLNNISVMPCEFDEAEQKMQLAAADLTDRDCEVLMDVVRAALAAAASIDPFDFDTIALWRAYRGDLHGYYRMVYDMIKDVLMRHFNKQIVEQREPVDPSDLPF